ncbi:MAG: flagellar motor switch protein FliN, partial [Deltaproteobacteria bacterium]|nr:flagellar motor switch protein FliN [Deltaproteobacteria bacterium]
MTDNLLSQDEIDALLKGAPMKSSETSSSAQEVPSAQMTSQVNPATNELDRFYDIILESCKIVLNAALNREVNFTTDKHKKNTLDQFVSENQGKIDFAIDISFKEGITGKFFILFEEQLGLFIGDLMVGNDGSELPKKLDEMYESAIMEAANQIMGNACNNLNLLFGTNVDFDSPILTEVVYNNGIDIDVGEESYCYPVKADIPGIGNVEMKFIIPEALAQDILFILKGVDAAAESSFDLPSAQMPELDSFSQNSPEIHSAPVSDGPISFDQSESLIDTSSNSNFSGSAPRSDQPALSQADMNQQFQQPMPKEATQQYQQPYPQQSTPQIPSQQPYGQPGINMGYPGMAGFQQMSQMPGAQQYQQPYPQQPYPQQPIPQIPSQQPYGQSGMNMGYPGMAGFQQMPQMPNDHHVQAARFDQLGSATPGTGASNLDILLDVPLQITVELGRTTKTVKEILEIGAGSVVELNKLAGESVELLVNNRLIAKGEVVVIDENFGIRITSI